MNDRNEHNDIVLSQHERLALQHIEADLSGDRRLARRMGHLGDARPWRLLALSVTVLMCASLFLAFMGFSTTNAAFIWGFAGLWPFTLLQAFRLLCRVSNAGDHVTSWL